MELEDNARRESREDAAGEFGDAGALVVVGIDDTAGGCRWGETIRLYDLRHSNNALLAAQGAGVEVRRELLGHSTSLLSGTNQDGPLFV